MISLSPAAPRLAKLTALSVGVAFLATACGGTSTPSSTETTTAPAGAISCPAGDGAGASKSAAAAPSGAVPASTTTSPEPLKIGSLLPTTGNLAFLGPPEIAGVELAKKEINAAGGVLGKPIEVTHRDSGDTKTDIATQSTTALLGMGVNAIVGAASSSVSKTVINQITGAGVVHFSPANTSPDFTTWDDKGLYWRTAPSDVLQGKVLGNFMATCGAQTVGMIVLNDAYGTGLAKNVKAAFEAAGGQVVAEELYNTGDTQFSSQIDKVVAAKPDAIVLISFDEAKSILPLITGKGVKSGQLFLVDGNTSDYSKVLQPGTMTGAHGTFPGTFAAEAFTKELLGVDPALKDFTYGGESYDAVNLIALAAESAKSVKGVDIAAKLKEVSLGGEKCTTYPSCVTLLRNGKDIDYDGQSGPVTFSDAGDPTEAYIGIYEYTAENTLKPVKSEFGKL
ncbi:ABC transporter substrate-binding protein [Arthrobacter sp. BE255]|jgi:branched-chain amino acid transport system substrate-binding protein|uniref:ABC transporter substrate-binding protein n=1 Tax=Arthrobacter sp. BE255 TaxID=2817721 RepID=UPI0028616793|nr:ABC transporter substrate-binding protein [Arthrobacter sp. BE255]MDR7161220.1 branched-chain amino acid transport system substrate-binding protein [Arthrobacter sp. BE255]